MILLPRLLLICLKNNYISLKFTFTNFILCQKINCGKVLNICVTLLFLWFAETWDILFHHCCAKDIDLVRFKPCNSFFFLSIRTLIRTKEKYELLCSQDNDHLLRINVLLIFDESKARKRFLPLRENKCTNTVPNMIIINKTIQRRKILEWFSRSVCGIS